MFKVLITAHPFGVFDLSSISTLKKNNIKIIFSLEKNIKKKIKDVDFYIAGTENITSNILSEASKLKFIARVGIGLDNINVNLLKKLKIGLSYTPDAQSESVSEFTIGLIISLIRNINSSDYANKVTHKWSRPVGFGLNDLKIGIIGMGRIGSLVFKKLKKLSHKNLYIFDTDKEIIGRYKNNFKSINFLIKNSDILTFHIPGDKKNKNFINNNLLKRIKDNSFIINTSRGSILNEKALIHYAKKKNIRFALDVFANEPRINKNLLKFKNSILTSHISAMTKKTRSKMEIQCVESIIKFINKKKDNLRLL